jgi:Na+(H+)/acetate symporter ActP
VSTGRILSVTGMIASGLCAAAGFMSEPALLGVSALVMFAGNVYAFIKSE